MHSYNIKTRHENYEKNYDNIIKLLVRSILYLRIDIIVVKEYN
jgi:Flp pilus assembly CpaF family ATPase